MRRGTPSSRWSTARTSSRVRTTGSRSRRLAAHDAVEPGRSTPKHVPVQEQQGAQRLVLGGGGHVPSTASDEKRVTSGRAHLPRDDAWRGRRSVAPDPGDVRLFRSAGSMCRARRAWRTRSRSRGLAGSGALASRKDDLAIPSPPAGSFVYWRGERASTMAITGILLLVAEEYREPCRAPQVSDWSTYARGVDDQRSAGGGRKAACPSDPQTSLWRSSSATLGHSISEGGHMRYRKRAMIVAAAAGGHRGRGGDPEGGRQCGGRRHGLRLRAGRGRPADVRHRGLRELRHRDARRGASTATSTSTPPPRSRARPDMWADLHRVGGARRLRLHPARARERHRLPVHLRARQPAGLPRRAPRARPPARGSRSWSRRSRGRRAGWTVRPHVGYWWADEGQMGRAPSPERLRFTPASAARSTAGPTARPSGWATAW